MNSNGDHGRGNVFAEVEKVDDRADDHTRSIDVCVCVCAELRIASTKERKKNRKRDKEMKERERKRSKEAKWEGKKFVTAAGREKTAREEASVKEIESISIVD